MRSDPPSPSAQATEQDAKQDADSLPAFRRATDDQAAARARAAGIGEFSRRVSHDLSNFLTVIRTYSELMMADVPLEHPNRGDLQEISDAAEATIGYVQRMSAAGRAGVSRSERISLDALVQETLANGLAADVEPFAVDPACPAMVVGSIAALGEALGELLRNAREASPEGAAISVRTRELSLSAPRVVDGVPLAAGRWGMVEIRDVGPGVHLGLDAVRGAPEVDPFQPFVSTKSGVRGAGLGLPIARAAAWAAGGQLSLGREAHETVARLWLPVVLTDSAAS